MASADHTSSLRAALSGLTTRGRAFLAAGLTAAACAYVFGQDALLRVGVLLAVLPLISAVLLVRTRYRVSSGRRLTPQRAAAGQETRVFLRLDNISRVPTGLLLLEDKVPYLLGPRPRFVLDRIEPRGFREVSYRVRSDLRGRYPLGPLQLRLTDPFGLCELNRAFAAFDVLTVVPQVQSLPPVRLSGERAGHGESHARALALAGDDDVIPREYRHGDDLRRVHWKSTARYGELMVRREEQPHQARATVLLDGRGIAHRGSGPASSFEWAVTAAASVGLHLIERGYRTRLLTDTGHSVPGPDGVSGSSPAESAGLLLDALAVVELSDGGSLARAEEHLRLGGEGLLVAVLGSVDEEQLTRLGRLRRLVSGGAVAVLLDTASWSGPRTPGAEATAEAQRSLRQAGWTVLAARAGDSLPELWRQADRQADSGPYPNFTSEVGA